MAKKTDYHQHGKISIRPEPDLRRMLEAEAKKRETPISVEVIRRLRMSFDQTLVMAEALQTLAPQVQSHFASIATQDGKDIAGAQPKGSPGPAIYTKSDGHPTDTEGNKSKTTRKGRK